MEVFFQHFFHMILGGLLVAGMIFGLIALLLFVDRRKTKGSGKKSKAPREAIVSGPSFRGRSKGRTKRGRKH